jgi:hypothetical protein
MASQNIPSQSCTHLLRILLVMVVVIKEVAIWCSFQGLLDIPGCWIIATCKVWMLSDHPSSSSASYAGRPQASKLLPPPLLSWSSFVCACEHKGRFSGPYWCPKLGLLGQIGFQTAFYWVNLVCKLVFKLLFAQLIWCPVLFTGSNRCILNLIKIPPFLPPKKKISPLRNAPQNS